MIGAYDLQKEAHSGAEWLPPAEFWKKYDAGEFGKPGEAAKPAP